MWLAFANREYQSFDMTWLAWYPWMVNVMTHVTIVWELSFAALIWNRWCRPVVLIGAVALHLGIGALLGMWTFGLIMLVGCSAFLPPEFAQALARSLTRQRSWIEPGKIVDDAPIAAPREMRPVLPPASAPDRAAASTSHSRTVDSRP
jgi:hypothetical protein